VNRVEFATLNPAELRALVSKNAALVEYAITEDRIFMFVVTQGAPELQVKVYPLGVGRGEITRKIANFRQSIDDPFGARELYDILLKPAEAQIVDKTKLIIVPDGPLWDVPFEALQLSEGKYVIDRASVSYVPSLSAFREMQKRRSVGVPNRVQASTLLVFAAPAPPKEVRDRLQTTYNGIRVPEMSAETTEIEGLKLIYGPTRIHLYADATAKKETLRTSASSASVLHFATPAILDQSVPMYSFVMLTPDPALRDDGLLRLSEVTNLNSRARVVVLPHFSRAQDYSSNALIALSWAWFVAGTPAVVLNRWEMSDSRFVSELHQRFKTAPNPEQFRLAILKLKSQTKPSHWAGFMFMGQ
jgi:CHAT domain-containing protein